MILTVYSEAPRFPATDQHPDAVRYVVAGHVVDAVGGEPTEAEIDAFLAPAPAQQGGTNIAVTYLKEQIRYELAVRAAVHGDADAISLLSPEATSRGISVIELANEIQAARSAQIAAILAA